eukprot:Phypoly_transcript_05017.p1 GENE.Phypoly_transcript_05017~~Phypoly_transcript_05017.p1  ORF type:complete len:605 (+),score=37.04 Phypoly_transcript_05017:81-1895(+)
MIFLLLLATFFFSSVCSSCTPFSLEESPLTSSTCSAFVSKEIYIVNQSVADAQLAGSEIFSFIETVKSVLPLKCYKSLVGLMCQNTFPTCANASGAISPNFPCQDLCTSVFTACESVAPLIGDIPINCTILNTTNCESNYFPAQPFHDTFDLRVNSCPSNYALKKKLTSDTEAYCELQCPDPEYTKDEWDKMFLSGFVVNVLSVIMVVFAVLSYLIDVKKRQFPIRLQLFLLISVSALAIAISLGGRHPERATMCKDAATYSTMNNNGLCGFQASLIFYGSFASSMWALICAGVFYMTVARQVHPFLIKRYELHFHVVAWGLGLVFLVVALRLNYFDFSLPFRTYCFITVDVTKSPSQDIYIFYIPIAIMLTMVTILFVLLLITLRSVNWESDALTGGLIGAQIRLLFIIAVFIVVLGVDVLSRFAISSSKTGEYYESEYNWAACRAKTELFKATNYPPECATDKNPGRRALGTVIFANMGLSVFGILVFMAFTSKKDTYVQWKTLIMLCFNRQFMVAWRCIKRGFNPFDPDRPIPLVGPGSVSTSSGPFRTTTSSTERETRDVFMSMASKAVEAEEPSFIMESGSGGNAVSTTSEEAAEDEDE